MASRVPLRPRAGQRNKNADENASSKLRQTNSIANNARGTATHGGKLGTALRRPVLNEVTTAAVNRKTVLVKESEKSPAVSGKRSRSSSITAVQRPPLAPVTHVAVSQSYTGTLNASRVQRPPLAAAQSTAQLPVNVPYVAHEEVIPSSLEREDSMEVEEPEQEVEAMIEVADSDDDEAVDPLSLNATVASHQEYVWPEVSPAHAERYAAEVGALREHFREEDEEHDATMVSEYADEIFAYMGELEDDILPNPAYMDDQNEITWAMRQTLIDWLLQVHLRYHMLPETLWIAVNVMDRFLSHRVVSLVKLQLVGVTAMFIASKYEEVLAPSADEFVFMTEKGYTKKEILKGERIILQTLDFKVSHYCSPYSWMRKISKADDYDIQTRTLSKFLAEVALLDHRFIRVKPSLLAAVGMYTARRMLGGDWNDAFVYHSGLTEEQVAPGFEMLLEKLSEPDFSKLYVYKKYAHKKFLKAATFAVEKAREMMGFVVPEHMFVAE